MIKATRTLWTSQIYDSQKQAEGYSSQRNGEERCRDYYRSDRYG